MKNLLRNISNRLYYKYLIKPPELSIVPVNMVVMPSPNYFKTTPNRQVKFIVLHATASSTLESAVRWFKDPTSKVSAHYVIGKDGSVVQMVDLDNIAWHAGKSKFTLDGKEYVNLNGCSIGIELVNLNNGKDTYDTRQINSCLTITDALLRHYQLGNDSVVGHKDIATDRKSDPVGWDMAKFKEALSFYQEKEKALTT